MKRYTVITGLIAILMIIPLCVSARMPVFGARLGMDVGFPSGATSVYKTGAGFSVGGVIRWELPRNFFIEPGLMFSFMAMTAKEPVSFDDEWFYQDAAKYYGLRIPLMAGYSFGVAPQTRLSLSTGPYMNINLSARQSLTPNMAAPDPLPDRTVNLFQHGWKRVDAGWGIRLSVTFAESYYVGITGGVSFTPLAVYGNKDKKIRIHRNTVAISLGYNF